MHFYGYVQDTWAFILKTKSVEELTESPQSISLCVYVRVRACVCLHLHIQML